MPRGVFDRKAAAIKRQATLAAKKRRAAKQADVPVAVAAPGYLEDRVAALEAKLAAISAAFTK